MRSPYYFLPPFVVLAVLYAVALHSGWWWSLPVLGVLVAGTAVAYLVAAIRITRYHLTIRRRAGRLSQLRAIVDHTDRNDPLPSEEPGWTDPDDGLEDDPDCGLDDAECPYCFADGFREKGTDKDFQCAHCYHRFPDSERSTRPVPSSQYTESGEKTF